MNSRARPLPYQTPQCLPRRPGGLIPIPAICSLMRRRFYLARSFTHASSAVGNDFPECVPCCM